MTAPTPVSQAQTAWNSTTTPKTVTVAVQAGDVLVAYCALESGQSGASLSVSDTGGNTWTKQRENSAGVSSGVHIAGFTAEAAATGSITVSFARVGGTGGQMGGVVKVWRDASVGASAVANNGTGSGAPSVDITTTGDNSALSAFVGDWNAAAGAGVWTPAAGTPTTVVDTVTTQYGIHSAYYADVGAAGSKTVGMSSPSTQRYGIIAIEVKGTAGGAGEVSGSLSATESGSDTATFTGSIDASGALSATEAGSDTVSFSGAIGASGTLGATEAGADVAAFGGSVEASGALGAVEAGADTAALSGSVEAEGTLAAAESGPDQAAFSGAVGSGVAGSLAATESGADGVSMAGTVTAAGSLAAAEAGGDAATFSGSVMASGTLAAAEAGADTAAFAGTVSPGGVSGSLSAVESGQDMASFTGSVENPDKPPSPDPVRLTGMARRASLSGQARQVLLIGRARHPVITS